MTDVETAARLARWRSHSQHLVGSLCADPKQAVAGLVAVQAQDYAPALWSVAQRSTLSTAQVSHALDGGQLVRTHVLRPTWHFVSAADLRWLLDLTSSRVLSAIATSTRDRGLDATTIDRSLTLIGEELGGRALTRAALGERLAKRGIADPSGERLGAIMMHAELFGLVCSGPTVGKQQTYALIDERVPPTHAPGDPLVELTVRYFTSHGPATMRDFAWWSSLLVSDIREAVDGAGDRLTSERIGDQTFVWAPGSEPTSSEHSIRLIHTYDEYLVGYAETKWVADPTGRARGLDGRPGYFVPLVLRDGRADGRWKRTVNKSFVALDVKLLDQWPQRDLLALQAEGERVGRALDLRTRLTAAVEAPSVLREALSFLFPAEP